MPETQKNNSQKTITTTKTLPELKKKLYEKIGKKIRADCWRLLLKYTTLSQNPKRTLSKKREEYKNFKKTHSAEKYKSANDEKTLEKIALIKKDVSRTLPESNLFRNEKVQNALNRILLIYSLRHPSNAYTQGMNDILAPIFAVFLSSEFSTDYITFENNLREYKKTLSETKILSAETDSYFVFSLLLGNMKRNYLKGFEGVYADLRKLDFLLKKADFGFSEHLRKNEVEVLNFGFRWSFCLLLREFSVELGILILDFFLVGDFQGSEFWVFLMLALLLKFSVRVRQLKKEQIIMFLQNLPTEAWGEEDIRILVAEAFMLKSLYDDN